MTLRTKLFSFLRKGNKVLCFDPIKNKIKDLKAEKIYISEPKLKDIKKSTIIIFTKKLLS